MTPEQRNLARHALGLDGRQKRSYRNRFVTGPGSTDHPAWMQMERDGLAWRRAGNELTGGDDLFGLTLTGARAALDAGENLCREDFPVRYYIADMRREWMGNPYVTFWRPKNAGYAYPLDWAGRYSEETVVEGGGYYAKSAGRSLERFAVPTEVVDRIAEAPGAGMIDGDAGPVVVNNVENRRKLRRAAFQPQS